MQTGIVRNFAAVMKIIDRIRTIFRRSEILHVGGFDWCGIGRYPFGETIFRNVVELLTDLCNDVTWANVGGGGNVIFAEFKTFFERYAQQILWHYYKEGYVVIGVHESGTLFKIMRQSEYVKVSQGDITAVESLNRSWRAYVMVSDTYRDEGLSDYALCRPFVKFLDNLMNASNTSAEKMGTFVVATPETPNGYPTPVVFTEEQKKQLETDIADEYGGLSKQRHIMILPRGMRFQVVSMEGVDRKLQEKVRLCVLAICDRLKVPANQVAIIDANSSKTLANGSELREGDFNKYQSFERLLQKTFVRFANEVGLKVDYTIYNKPERATEIQTLNDGEN